MLNTNTKIKCVHCGKLIFPHSVKRHDPVCHLNPENKKDCLVCGSPIKNFRNTKGTCSHSCSNKLFRTGENHGNWKQDRYQTTCFEYHEKKCVVCGEDKIVVVHHLDHNRKNNDPSNLIPMCPTHHQYWHSRYKNLVEDIVLNYINKWKNKLSLG